MRRGRKKERKLEEYKEEERRMGKKHVETNDRNVLVLIKV
jgi:hypothetical protein